MSDYLRITVPRPYDMHLHVRQGDMLRNVLPHTLRWAAGALIMPNTVPPVLTGAQAVQYREEIKGCLPPGSTFEPFMTVQITGATTPEMIVEAESHIFAGKVYPHGVTTNSGNGVVDYTALYPVFAEMQEYDLVLCLHGEDPAADCIHAEKSFLATLCRIAADFPMLRIVLEHVTTADAVHTVRRLFRETEGRVMATITVHHLFLTIDDILKDGIRPHNYCKPVAKFAADREALLEAVLEGHPAFMLGTDSAPHDREKKIAECGCAGIFTAPVALPMLVNLFVVNRAERWVMNDFFMNRARHFYRLSDHSDDVTLERRPWTVPAEYGGVVPFMAGKELAWQIVD